MRRKSSKFIPLIDLIARMRKLSGVFLIDRVTDPRSHHLLYVEGVPLCADVLRPGCAPAVFWKCARGSEEFIRDGGK